MSLRLETIHRLRGKGFDTLYTKHSAKWNEMVAQAKAYASTYISDQETIRPGDLADILTNAMEPDPDFEGHVKGRGLTQKYWVTWFCEYVVEQVYPPPTIE